MKDNKEITKWKKFVIVVFMILIMWGSVTFGSLVLGYSIKVSINDIEQRYEGLLNCDDNRYYMKMCSESLLGASHCAENVGTYTLVNCGVHLR